MSSVPLSLVHAPHPHPDHARVVLTGDFDLADVDALTADIDGAIERGGATVEVDMSGVTYFDSTALCVLLGACDRLVAQDRRLVVTRASNVVARLFDICGVTSTLMPDSVGRAAARPR